MHAGGRAVIPFRNIRDTFTTRSESTDLGLQFVEPVFAISAEIARSKDYVTKAHIADHEFFELASESRPLVRLWVAQELCITNAFSQILLGVAAMLPNVYLRRHFLEVVVGEHGDPNEEGDRALPHPVLLRRAADAVGLNIDGITMLPQTQAYLSTLSKICSDGPLAALGAIGVGNEALLVDEYKAACSAFQSAFGSKSETVFFSVNIDADDNHYEICASTATAHCALYGEKARNYDYAAERAIMARAHFYEELVRAHRRGKLPVLR
jgi:Iron-containing redox enzyme